MLRSTVIRYQALHTHKNVDEAAEGASEMLQELLLTMEDSASAAGYTSAMIDNISKSMALVSIQKDETEAKR